jgi:large subunit ribosomal protein L1
MPNPKVGTVTFDVARAVKELKAGRVEFKVDKTGIVHTTVGKISFPAEKLKDNVMALMDVIQRAKPASSKGTYMKSIAISTTMGPGIKLDPNDLRVATKT